MACFLGDINARALGLRARLLGPAELDRLARLPNLFVLQQELNALGMLAANGPSTARQLDRALRTQAASQLGLLARWSRGRRRSVLAVVFEDEDRRSLQALLRGAAAAASPQSRMADLIPTDTLPERALRTLAEQPTVADVVRVLLLWSHPLASSMAAAASETPPSLFRIETELNRAFARTALRQAKSGGRHLRAYARQTVDLMNAYAALLHFPERHRALTDLAFVEGGALLGRDDFDSMMGLQTPEELSSYLAQQFRGHALSQAFEDAAPDPSKLETSVLRAQIDEQRRAMLRDPLGAAPIIGFALELRAQLLDLRRIVWGVAMKAPPAMRYGEQVSA